MERVVERQDFLHHRPPAVPDRGHHQGPDQRGLRRPPQPGRLFLKPSTPAVLPALRQPVGLHDDGVQVRHPQVHLQPRLLHRGRLRRPVQRPGRRRRRPPGQDPGPDVLHPLTGTRPVRPATPAAGRTPGRLELAGASHPAGCAAAASAITAPASPSAVRRYRAPAGWPGGVMPGWAIWARPPAASRLKIACSCSGVTPACTKGHLPGLPTRRRARDSRRAAHAAEVSMSMVFLRHPWSSFAMRRGSSSPPARR